MHFACVLLFLPYCSNDMSLVSLSVVLILVMLQVFRLGVLTREWRFRMSENVLGG